MISNNVVRIVNKGYSVGMVQERGEITQLTEYLLKKNPKNVMEIGSKFGGTFEILCNIATGKKISIDLPGGKHGGWITKEHPYLGDSYKLRNTYFKTNYTNTHMITGNSHHTNTKDEVLKILNGDLLDFLFIDGDHSYYGVSTDWKLYKDLVRPGGSIAFHDINDTKHHRDLDVWVGKFWDELDGDKITFNCNKHWAGIGVINV